MSDGGIDMAERVVFIEEAGPGKYLKLVAIGEVDGTMLGALEDYMRRQRKRLETVVSEQEPGERQALERQKAITPQNYFT